MILQDDDVFFIDFGLGMVSDLVEDKGVDLLVFKKAISGIHHEISKNVSNPYSKDIRMHMIMMQLLLK